METSDFDKIMDMCDEVGFKNRDNRVIIPKLAMRLSRLMQAYIMVVCQEEDTATVDEAFHGLAIVMLMHDAKRCGIDPDKVLQAVDSIFEAEENDKKTEKNPEGVAA